MKSLNKRRQRNKDIEIKLHLFKTQKMLKFRVMVLLGTCVLVRARTPLYVGALFEFSEHWFKDYTPFFPKIIEHAVKEIQNNSDILQDYELQISYRDTKVFILFIFYLF